MVKEIKITFLLYISSLAFFVGLTISEEPLWPPKPDFKTEIDYVKWYNNQLQSANRDNAWQDYKAIFQKQNGKYQWPEPNAVIKHQLEALASSPASWNAKEKPHLSDYLDSLNTSFKHYIEGARHKHFGYKIENRDGHDKNLLEVPLPYLTASRIFTNALIVSAWKDDGSFKAEYILTVLKHANHIQQGIWLVDQRLAYEEKRNIFESVYKALEKDVLEPYEIIDIKDCLQYRKGNDLQEQLYNALSSEMAYGYSLLQNITKFSNNLLFWETKPEIDKDKAIVWLRRFGVTDNMSLRERNQLLQRIKSKSPEELAQAIEDYVTTVAKKIKMRLSPKNIEYFDNLFDKYKEKYAYFGSMPFVNYSNIYKECLEIERQKRIVLVVANLISFLKINGQYPESLESICKNKVMVIDPVTNDQFIYKLKGDKALLECSKAQGFEHISLALPTD